MDEGADEGRSSLGFLEGPDEESGDLERLVGDLSLVGPTGETI